MLVCFVATCFNLDFSLKLFTFYFIVFDVCVLCVYICTRVYMCVCTVCLKIDATH